MQVNILYFAFARDITKTESETLQLTPDSNTLAALKQLISKKYPSLMMEKLLFAVNCQYEEDHDQLKLSDGDEIALIPPVSGG